MVAHGGAAVFEGRKSDASAVYRIAHDPLRHPEALGSGGSASTGVPSSCVKRAGPI